MLLFRKLFSTLFSLFMEFRQSRNERQPKKKSIVNWHIQPKYDYALFATIEFDVNGVERVPLRHRSTVKCENFSPSLPCVAAQNTKSETNNDSTKKYIWTESHPSVSFRFGWNFVRWSVLAYKQPLHTRCQRNAHKFDKTNGSQQNLCMGAMRYFGVFGEI